MAISLDRRTLLRGAAASALVLPFAEAARASGDADAQRHRAHDFTFVHITDLHIQPERGAKAGVAKAFAAIHALPHKPDFALIGGDLVMDAAKVSPERAALVYDLWQSAAADLGLPMHYTIGNHDVYGLGEAAADSARAQKNPDFGKSIWKRRLGLTRTYNTFDHKGWRFVTLDSLLVGADGHWGGYIDPAQMTWLDDLLRKTPRKMPVVMLTHLPLLTIFGQYTLGTTSALPEQLVVKNGREFQELIQGHNVKVVFQGHTHVVEECEYLGTRYVTGGAVCGDWWKGWRLGVHPEGFTVVTVRGDELSWNYTPYGWGARKYQPPTIPPDQAHAKTG